MNLTTSPAPFRLRAAEARDVPAIVGLIRELADYERLGHLVQATVEKLHPQLFGDRPAAQAMVAEVGVGVGVAPDGVVGGAVGDPAGEAANGAASSVASSAERGAAGVAPGDVVRPKVVGFALFFTNFSTFLAQPGLYLEDLYVVPAHRGAGIGRAFLTELAALAVERGCGRFEWSVLDWNEPAIGFYRGMGATVMPEWRICRVSGEALDRLAAKKSGASAKR